MLLDDNERIFFCQKMKQLSHCPRFDKKGLKTLFSISFKRKRKIGLGGPKQ
jgi:hypothetical protein